MFKPIIDEFTNIPGLTKAQRFRLRHPEKFVPKRVIDKFSYSDVPYNKRWRLRHPGAQAKANASWRSRHPEYRRQWEAANSEKRKEYEQRYIERHPNGHREATRRHDLKRRNPERLAYKRALMQKLRDKIFEVYGYTCTRCGFADRRALQLDHVNNDGASHRKTKSQSKVWREAVAEYRPDRFQILCANCNWIKRSEAYACKKESSLCPRKAVKALSVAVSA